MTITVTPLPTKINPNPNQPIDDADTDNKVHAFPFYFLMMMPNTIGSFATAYHRNDKDYSLAVLCLLVFSVFMLVDCCLVWYLAMPKTEKSSRKLCLKVTMWLLYTIISFGFVYMFSYFLGSQTTMALYVVVFVGSGVLLFLFVLADLFGGWKISTSQILNGRNSNHEYSVLERV